MNTFIVVALFSFFVSCLACSQDIPYVKAVAETTPIPLGQTDTDDIAIWINDKNIQNSFIIGVSKYEDELSGLKNKGGLGVYDLNGKEVFFLNYGRMNNVDLRYDFFSKAKEQKDLIVSTNREGNSLSFFSIKKNGTLTLINDIPIFDTNGKTKEPYGLCLYHNKEKKSYFAFLPMKDGLIYRYEIKTYGNNVSLKPMSSLNTANLLTTEEDDKLKALIEKFAIYDGELDELDKHLKNRHQLEGCVVDDERGILYLGMEKFGLIKISHLDKSFLKGKILHKISHASIDDNAKFFPPFMPRLTNDIEGIALYKKKHDQGLIVVSIQGISEFAVFNRKTEKYIGSFEIKESSIDGVSETDGLDILSLPINNKYKKGLLVVHDDNNTNSDGITVNGNYKIISFEDVLNALDL